jgi:hypothetical protein
MLAAGVGRGRPIRTKNLSDPILAKVQGEMLAAKYKLDKAIKTTPPPSTWDIVSDYLNIGRPLLASGDVGHMFRQGGLLAPRNPIEWGKASWNSIKLLFSDKNLYMLEALRENNPNFEKAMASGLNLTPHDVADEFYRGAKIWQKVPVLSHIINASERSFTEFGNMLRFELFYKYADLYGDSISDDQYRLLAGWLNKATGKGNLGRLQPVSKELSFFGFAPSWYVSKIQTPLGLMSKSPVTRKIAAQNIAAFIGMNASFLALAKASGAKVELDPDAPSFGNAQIGNHHYNIWGGRLTDVRFMFRLAKNTFNSFAGRDKQAGRKNVNIINSYIRGKLSPFVGSSYSAATGTNFVGEPYTKDNMMNIVEDGTVQLFMQDMIDAYKDGGWQGTAEVAIPAWVGIAANTYKDKTPSAGARPTRRTTRSDRPSR